MAGWRLVEYEDDGRPYYYHLFTQKTTWYRPPEFASSAVIESEDESEDPRADALEIDTSGSGRDGHGDNLEDF